MRKDRLAAVGRLLTHHVVTVVDRGHLRARLLRGEKLRVKLGADPTAPDLHIGHGVVLRKLREFQDLGQTVVFIIGDGTARVGDPSGRSKTRPPLAREEIHANADTYLKQVGTFIDVRKAEVHFNSEWLDTLRFADLLNLMGAFTVARLLERGEFAKRMRAKSPIGFHELLYPVLQGYDSVAVRADMELGGTDQTFNLLAGRDVLAHLKKPPQDILTVPLLVGLDGKEKMSKSLGNAVGITESPDSMVGKLMTIPDAVIADYARLGADWPEDKVKALTQRLKRENPRDVKLDVARAIVALYHGVPAARQAAGEWLRVFHQKELPKKVPAKKLRYGTWDIAELLVAAGLSISKSEARRLVAQGGVRHHDTRVGRDTQTLSIKKGDLLQVGKRKFARVS